MNVFHLLKMLRQWMLLVAVPNASCTSSTATILLVGSATLVVSHDSAVQVGTKAN